MLELMAYSSIAENIIDTIGSIISQDGIMKVYDFSSSLTERKLTISGNVDILNRSIDITLNYKSHPIK